jgi:hypothetical protein
MRRIHKRYFEIVDVVAAGLFFAGFFLWGHRWGGETAFLSLLEKNRAAIYQTIAGVYGTIFGFTLTAVSIVLTFANSPRIEILRSSRHWSTLWQVFIRAIRWSAIVAFWALGLLITDTDSHQIPSAFISQPRWSSIAL